MWALDGSLQFPPINPTSSFADEYSAQMRIAADKYLTVLLLF